MTPAPRRHRDWILVAFFLIGGVFCLVPGMADVYARSVLDRGVSTVDAAVTAHELSPCRGISCGPPYRIRYKFFTDSGSGPFTYTGQRLLLEAWVRVPETTWKLALERRLIEIRYARDDPRINEPTSTAHYSRANGLGLVMLSILLFSCAIVVFRIGRRSGKSSAH